MIAPSRRTAGNAAATTSGQAAFGGCLTLIAAVLGLGLFGVLFYVQQNGTITLASAKAVVAVAVAIALVALLALLCSLLAMIINLTAVAQAFRVSRALALLCSAVLLLVLTIFTFTTLLPRGLALEHLGTQVAPFAYTLRDSCQQPLQKVANDLNKTANDDQVSSGNDQQFAAVMQADANLLQQDATLLSNGYAALQPISAPDAKYQPLLNDCQKTTSGVSSFLTDDNGPHAIPLPVPLDQLVAPKVSGIRLLRTLAALAAGTGPVQVPASDLQPALAAAIPPILALIPAHITSEGDQLLQDIRTTLDANIAPFKENIALN